MAITYTITEEDTTITYTIDDGVGAPGSDASVTLANVRAAVPNMVEVVSPANDDMIQRVGGSWVTRTIAQVRTALGLGSAAYTASTAYATSTQGAKADAALPKSGGSMTGQLDMNGNTIIQVFSLGVQTSVSSDTVDALSGYTSEAGAARFPEGLKNTSSNTISTLPNVAGALVATSDSRLTDERVPNAAGLTSKFGTNKATLVDGDKVAILDSAASDAPKHGLLSAVWAYLQSKFAAASSKTTPIDADSFNIVDSADSNAAKRVTGTNLKAYLKTYLDTLYVALTGNQTAAGNKTLSGQLELTGQAATNSTSAMTKGLVLENSSDPSNIVLVDDFVGYGVADTRFGNLDWSIFSSGGGSGAAIGNPTVVLPQYGVRTLTCGNATNAGYAIVQNSLTALLTKTNWQLTYVAALSQTTDCDIICGITKDNSAYGIGLFGGISFGARYSSAHDTDFMFYSKNGNSDFAANDANNYAISSGVAANTSYHTFRIRSLVAGSIEMRINGGSWVAVNTSGITTTGIFLPIFYISTRTTASKSMNIDYWSLKAESLSR